MQDCIQDFFLGGGLTDDFLGGGGNSGWMGETQCAPPPPYATLLCVCTCTQKASVEMYSGCDTLSLQILFVYFLALPSLLHPSILFNCLLLFFFFSALGVAHGCHYFHQLELSRAQNPWRVAWH